MHPTRKRLVIFCGTTFLLTGFASFHPVQKNDNMLTDAEKKAGWVLLFDGKSTQGWRTYNNQPNDSWEVVNGELHCKDAGVQHRADLVTKNQYSSFELSFD